LTEGGTIVILIVELVQFTLRGIMKNVVKKLVRSEQGAALILVLVVLLVGGLIAGGLLQHMGAGLLSGEVYARRTAELYGADAGVEDAMWKIQHAREAGLPGCGNQWVYTYPEPGDPVFEVNGKSVVVTIQHLGAGAYNITSIAITIDDSDTAAIDSTTTVEAYVTADYSDFSGFLDNAITSGDDITIRGRKTSVSGNISLPPGGELTPSDYDPENGEVKREELIWPTMGEVAGFYWPDVGNLTAVPDGYLIDIPSGTTEDNPFVVGPLSGEGDLTIKGDGWLKIAGTVYVKGDFVLNVNPTISMALSQQTIFAEGGIYVPPKTNISGSGCMIAGGAVQYNPSISSGAEDFLLVMSVEGTIQLNPGSNFYGSIVGNTDVTLQPSITLSWSNPEGKGINFPGMDPSDPSKWTWAIDTWEVSQQ